MIIPRISIHKQNFGTYYGWTNPTGKDLKREELYILNRIKAVLDNKQGKHIDIVCRIAEPHPENPSCKRLKFFTTPMEKDMAKIKAQPGRKAATSEQYTRNSGWFDLKAGVEWEISAFIDRQIRYIRRCTEDPNHTSQIIRKNRK